MYGVFNHRMVRTAIRLTHRLVKALTMVQITTMICCRNASKNLIKEVDVQASVVIAKNPNIIDDALPTCLIQVDIIQKLFAKFP